MFVCMCVDNYLATKVIIIIECFWLQGKKRICDALNVQQCYNTLGRLYQVYMVYMYMYIMYIPVETILAIASAIPSHVLCQHCCISHWPLFNLLVSVLQSQLLYMYSYM